MVMSSLVHFTALKNTHTHTHSFMFRLKMASKSQNMSLYILKLIEVCYTIFYYIINY